MKKIRSAKGQVVDFDLMKIKESIGSEPAPQDTARRQNHIDTRLRRRMRNMKKTPLSTTAVPEVAPATKPTKKTQPPRQPVEVAPTPTAVNEADVEFIDGTDEPKPKKNSQQKARNKPTQED